MIHLANHDPETLAERAQLLSAFVDFSCVSMVRAGGALLHFVDKNYRLDETPDVLFISTLTLSSILAVDWATLTSLQVTHPCSGLYPHNNGLSGVQQYDPTEWLHSRKLEQEKRGVELVQHPQQMFLGGWIKVPETDAAMSLWISRGY